MITIKMFHLTITTILVFSLNYNYTCADDSQPDPSVMTKWGPKLSEEELATIAKLPTGDLVKMLKEGDAIHHFAALKQLKSEAHGGIEKNFDLLLKIASETSGNMIVEGLLSPVKQTSSAEDKVRVDKFLDFLENELKKDKPSVSRQQAIRSIAQTVFLSSAIKDKWRPFILSENIPDPYSLPIPYDNDRVIKILTQCLDHRDWQVRAEAILWLGEIGANDFKKADDIVALLHAQLAKEKASTETEKVKVERVKSISNSLEILNHNIMEIEDRAKKDIPSSSQTRPVDIPDDARTK